MHAIARLSRLPFRLGPRVFVCAIVCATVSVCFYRLRFGLDFTDESYYIAMAVRFLRGDIPFVDELFVNQTATLITLPLIRPYYSMHGTEGILLYTRILYFIFSLALAACAYLALSRVLGRMSAVLVSLVAVAFVPLNIPNLSYNTLGGGLFAISVFLGASYLLSGGGLLTLFCSSIAAGLASFAYPPLILAGIFLSVILLARSHPNNLKTTLKTILVIGAGYVLVAATFLPYLLNAGDRLTDAVRYTLTAHHHGGGWLKLKSIFFDVFWWDVARGLWLALAALGTSAIFARRRPVLEAVALALFPMLLAYAYREYIFPSVWFMSYFTLAGGLFFLLSDRSTSQDHLFWAGWAPSIVAGFITGWTSASSAANVVIGFWAAGILTAAFLMSAITRATRGTRLASLPVVTQTSVILILIANLFLGQVFYCDADLSQLTERISAGPYRGFFTTPAKAKYLDGITRDIQRLDNKEGRVLFYEFPAGYLLTSMRPAANSAWIRTESLGKNYYARYYRDHLSPLNLVFVFHTVDLGFPSPVTYNENDPLVALLRQTHHLILHRWNYDVFAPGKPRTLAPELPLEGAPEIHDEIHRIGVDRKIRTDNEAAAPNHSNAVAHRRVNGP